MGAISVWRASEGARLDTRGRMGGGVVGMGVDQILTTCSSQCGTVLPQDATIPSPF